MIALNLETGKEVVMSYIAIAIEFVKSFFKHVVKVTTVFGKWLGLSLILVAAVTRDAGTGFLLSHSIVASINLPWVVTFITLLSVIRYLEEKGVF